MTDTVDTRNDRFRGRLDRMTRAAEHLEAGTHGLSAEDLAEQLSGWLRLEVDTLAALAPLIDLLADVIHANGGPEPLRDILGTRLPAAHVDAASYADQLSDRVLGAPL